MSTPEPIVVSYHTPDPFYANHAARLRESLRVRRVQHVIACLEPAGQTWHLRCQAKAGFIARMQAAFPDRIVIWIDADGELIEPKDEFMQAIPHLNYGGIAAYRNLTPERTKAFPLINSTLMSGTLAFAPGSEQYLKAWMRNTAHASPDEYDQELLARVLDRLQPSEFKQLDPRLVCVPDLMPGVDPIVLHHQASRDPASGKR